MRWYFRWIYISVRSVQQWHSFCVCWFSTSFFFVHLYSFTVFDEKVWMELPLEQNDVFSIGIRWQFPIHSNDFQFPLCCIFYNSIRCSRTTTSIHSQPNNSCIQSHNPPKWKISKIVRLPRGWIVSFKLRMQNTYSIYLVSVAAISTHPIYQRKYICFDALHVHNIAYGAYGVSSTKSYAAAAEEETHLLASTSSPK